MVFKGRHVDKTLRLLEIEVGRCEALNCDEVEMECLKAIVLYNAGRVIIIITMFIFIIIIIIFT